MSFTYPKLRLGKSIGKKLRPIPCGGATCAIMQCSVVRMVWLVYYREPHSGRLVRKSWFFHGFSREYHHRHHRKYFQWPGNVVWDISGEKYFHRFSNCYFEAYFLLHSVENFMLFGSKVDSYVRVHHDSTDKTYENHWNFWWNHAKIMVQNRSCKIDENMFMWIVPK